MMPPTPRPPIPPFHVAVTGGRGRLAPAVIAHLRAQGLKVSGLSRRAGDGLAAYSELPELAARQPVDCLLHLAWSKVPATAENGPFDPTPDVALVRELLERSATIGPGGAPAHFVFFSSGGAVYGNCTRPAREDDPCHPVGNYGRAKLLAEEQVRARQSAQPCAVLRISNPFGFDWSATRPQGLIPFAFAAALRGTPLEVWGDGSARKDFLHRDDFFRALDAILANRLTGTHNVAFGQSHTVAEVLDAVERVTGRRISRHYSPPRAWDVHTSLLEVGKLRAAADWTPQVPFEQGLERMQREIAAGQTVLSP